MRNVITRELNVCAIVAQSLKKYAEMTAKRVSVILNRHHLDSKMKTSYETHTTQPSGPRFDRLAEEYCTSLVCLQQQYCTLVHSCQCTHMHAVVCAPIFVSNCSLLKEYQKFPSYAPCCPKHHIHISEQYHPLIFDLVDPKLSLTRSSRFAGILSNLRTC